MTFIILELSTLNNKTAYLISLPQILEMWLEIGCSYDYLNFFLHLSKSRKGQLWGKLKNNSLKTAS